VAEVRQTCAKCGTRLYDGDDDELCEWCLDERQQEWKLGGLCEECGAAVPAVRPYLYQLCLPCWRAWSAAVERELIFVHGFPTADGSVWSEEDQEFY
jgi:hypothetical protein